ncbi:MAG: hypothetical protein PHV13_02825 [Candidatus ainarchaeum sp.]|nr:hypothetical protein [Candidatus ainarchaeum sp.]
MRMSYIITIAALIMLLASPSFASLYVATNGTDNSTCTDSASPCLTINYAIGQANANDTVYVFNGTYTEDVVVNKTNLTLQGAGRDNTTIQGTALAVTVSSGGVTVAGFKITTQGDYSIKLSNSVQNPTVRDCTITGKAFTLMSAGGYSNIYVINNIFANISAPTVIFKEYGDNLHIYNNLFYNITTSPYAMIAGVSSPTYLYNNTFAKINAYPSLVLSSGPSMVMKNNIFRGVGTFHQGASPTSRYNIYSDISEFSGLTDGTGDIYANPFFVNYTSNDYRLMCGSPAVNSSEGNLSNRGWYLGPCVDLGPLPYDGPIWYVDGTNGNDSTGDGSQTKPFATIQKAADLASGAPPAQIIMIAPGTYSGNIVVNRVGLALQGSGPGITILTSTSGNTITFNAGYGTVSDMTVLSNGQAIVSPYNNQTIKNNVIGGSSGSNGVVLGGGSSSNIIMNNTIANIGVAIDVFNGNSRIYNNLIYNVSMAYTANAASVYAENNTFARASFFYWGGNAFMKNNIFANITYFNYTYPNIPNSSYNVFYGVSSPLNGTGDVVANPLFVNSSTNDYRLACGSSAFNMSDTNQSSIGWYQGLEVGADGNAGTCVQCNNGVDDNGNGKTDWNGTIKVATAEPNCYGNPNWTDESTPRPLPQVSIQAPANATPYNSTILALNYTVGGFELQSCWYVLNGAAPVLLPSCANTTITGIQQNNTITVYANDSVGYTNSSTVGFNIDSITPQVSIQAPTEGTWYDSTSVALNYTANDTNLVSCWYVLNGAAPVALPGCANTTITGVQQNNTITVYDNDSAGNVNSSTVGFNIDSIVPQISVQSPVQGKWYNYTSIALNYTANDTNLVSCWYVLNGAAPVALPSCDNGSFTGPEGLDNITVYDNDSAGNTNSSTINFNIDSLTPVVSFVNISDNGTKKHKYVQINVSVLSGSLANVTIYLYDRFGNLTRLSVGYTSDYFANFTNLSYGFYYYNATAFSSAGSRGDSETRNVTLRSQESDHSQPQPLCQRDGDCAMDEMCSDGSCVAVPCPCGQVADHLCNPYECCSDSACSANQTCQSHQCVAYTPPECTMDSDCASDERCSAGSCVPCPCGANQTCQGHQCVAQPPQCIAPSCCAADDQCADNQRCDIPLGRTSGSCSNITACGRIAAHAVAEQWQCGEAPDCRPCAQGLNCTQHFCINPLNVTIAAPVVGVPVGEAVVINPTMASGGLCRNCDVVIAGPNGTRITGTTDANGQLNFTPQAAGQYNIALFQNGQPVLVLNLNAAAGTGAKASVSPGVAALQDLAVPLLTTAVIVFALVALYLRGTFRFRKKE